MVLKYLNLSHSFATYGYTQPCQKRPNPHGRNHRNVRSDWASEVRERLANVKEDGWDEGTTVPLGSPTWSAGQSQIWIEQLSTNERTFHYRFWSPESSIYKCNCGEISAEVAGHYTVCSKDLWGHVLMFDVFCHYIISSESTQEILISGLALSDRNMCFYY